MKVLLVRNSYSISHSFNIAQCHLNKIFGIVILVILVDVHFCHLINTDFILQAEKRAQCTLFNG